MEESPPCSPPPSPPCAEEIQEGDDNRNWGRFEDLLREEGFTAHWSDADNQLYYTDNVSGDCFWAEEINSPIVSEVTGASDYSPSSDSRLEERRQNSNVVERSSSMLMNKNRKIEQIKNNLEERERSSITGAPQLTKKSEGINRSVEDMLAWEQMRKAKLREKMLSAEEEKRRSITGRPEITKKAHSLRRAAEDDVSMNSMSDSSRSVQDRLYDYAEVRKARLQRLQEIQNQAIREAAHPKIDDRSARLVRGSQGSGDSVHNRLFQYAYSNRSVGGSDRLHQHDEATGQRLFAPKINKTSDVLAKKYRAPVAVEDILHEKGQVYRSKLAIRERNKLEQEARLRERPKINPTSKRIVDERMQAFGETTEDRLVRPIGNFKERTLMDIPQPTFQPQISSSSRELLSRAGYRQTSPIRSKSASRNGNVFYCSGEQAHFVGNSSGGAQSGVGIYDRSLHWENLKQKKIAKEQERRRNAELAECSFHPTIGQYSNSDGYIGSSKPIADRHAEWARHREERLNELRRSKSEEELRACTFAPKVERPSHLSEYEASYRTDSALSSSRVLPSHQFDPALEDPEWPLPQPPRQFSLANPDYYRSDFRLLEQAVQPTSDGYSTGYSQYEAHASAAHPPGMEDYDDEFSMSAAVELE